MSATAVRTLSPENIALLDALQQEYTTTVLEAKECATTGAWTDFDVVVSHLHWITETTVNVLASDVDSSPEEDEEDE
jgi:hypothetical protein